MSLRQTGSIFRLVLLLVLVAGCGPLWSQVPATADPQPAGTPLPDIRFWGDDEEIPLELRQQAFTNAWETLRDNYYDPRFNGVDWDRIRTEYEPKIAGSRTGKAFHAMLNAMANELPSSHLAVLPPSALRPSPAPASAPRYALSGVELRLADGRIVFFRVEPDSPAWQAGVRPGDILVRAGERFPGDPDPALSAADHLSQARRALVGSQEEAAVLQIRSPDGGERTVRAARTRPAQARFDMATARLAHRQEKPGVGYIWFDSWAMDLQPKLEAAMKELRPMRGIILDLRQNPGGVNPGADYLASALNAEPGKLMIDRLRNGETREWTYPGSGADAYPGKVVILVDETSASTSEVFAAALQESGRAVVIGRRTYGGVLNSTQALLPTGGVLQYPHSLSTTPKGQCLEGRGVTPDIPLELQPADLAQGKDTLIERAASIILGGE